MPARPHASTRPLAVPIAALTSVAMMLASAAPAWAAPARTARVSVNSADRQSNGGSSGPSTSAGGRFVVFESLASNLVKGDTNGAPDVFIRDRKTTTTTRVSVNSNERQGNGGSYSAQISADGRFVAFMSDASNLVPRDTNGLTDVFVRDLRAGTTRRVSVRSSGSEANGASFDPAVSADGRFIAFKSNASNLVAGDTNGASDILVRDLRAGTTTRVSVRSNGDQGNGSSAVPSISADGRFVAFQSNASNLVAGDANAAGDVFVRDRQRDTTARVSVRTDGTEGNDESSAADISDDGRFVAFGSYATNLVGGDSNSALDVFVRDRQARTTARVSLSSGGVQADSANSNPTISGDGRFVAFESLASNLVGGDSNGTWDVFVRDRRAKTTKRLSVSSGGAQGDGISFDAWFSADGHFVAFISAATDLVPSDTNGVDDIFIRGPLG